MTGELNDNVKIQFRDRFDYEVPVVALAPITENGIVVGYQPDPPFDMTWDNLTTLRHLAALIETRSGLRVRVASCDVKVKGPDDTEDWDEELYDVLTAHTTGGPAAYETTWAWLSGFEIGASEVGWKDYDQPTI